MTDEKVVTHEPGEVGTRVRDGNGIEWVRALGYGGPAPWMSVTPMLDDTRDTWSMWSAITPPTVVIPPGREAGQ